MLPDTRQRLEEAFSELQGLVVSCRLPTWLRCSPHAAPERLAVFTNASQLPHSALLQQCCCCSTLTPCTRVKLQEPYIASVGQCFGRESRPTALPQEELGGGLAGSEELAQAEEQVAAVQPLFA